MREQGSNARSERADNQAEEEGIRVDADTVTKEHDRQFGALVRQSIQLQVAVQEAHQEIARLTRLLETARPEATSVGPVADES